MKKLFTPFIVLLITGLCVLPAQAATHPPAKKGKSHMVKLHTNQGTITLQLDAEKAPITVKNFEDYVTSGHFSNTIFHRVIDNFMIQGGGFEPGMNQKSINAPIKNEAANGLKNDKYTIAMARTGDPHSASAQFFINLVNNVPLDYPSRDHECAHAKRQQACGAGEGPLGEKDRRAPGPRRFGQARCILHALLDVVALDEISTDGAQEHARQQRLAQFALCGKAVAAFGQGGEQDQAVEITRVVGRHHERAGIRDVLQAVHHQRQAA